MELKNLSPFAARAVVVPDREGREELLVVVKATWEMTGGRTRIAEEQTPLRLADEYWGEPGETSLRFATDLATEKPWTDVVFAGCAWAPSRTARVVDARFRVGPLEKRFRVFGDRFWTRSAGFLGASSPEPFGRMPLTWDRAYGGLDRTGSKGPESEPRNPVGVGFRAGGSRLGFDGTRLPNVENPEELVTGAGDRPTPWGGAFVAPNWEARARWAGTYDQAWERDRSPLLPEDFDPRFHQAAPPDQIVGELPAGTPVELEGLSPSGLVAVELPVPDLEVAVKTDRRHALEARSDTLVIDGDGERLVQVARARFPLHDGPYAVQWIRVAGGERN